MNYRLDYGYYKAMVCNINNNKVKHDTHVNVKTNIS